jgi:D-aminoacyl-tRNA deacylase
MRALVQRVTEASVSVDGAVVGAIGPGLLVLACAMRGDADADAEWLARKVVALRIFRDAEGRMNRSLADVDGAALVVSQFTLAAETRGNRPGFSTAAAPDEGRRLYDLFSDAVAAQGVVVANGVFGAEMRVALVNDGPVTIWLDSGRR